MKEIVSAEKIPKIIGLVILLEPKIILELKTLWFKTWLSTKLVKNKVIQKLKSNLSNNNPYPSYVLVNQMNQTQTTWS